MPAVQLLPDGCPDIRVGSTVQQQLSEWRNERSALLVVHPEIGLRNHGCEQGCVTAEPGRADSGTNVDVHSLVEQPDRNLHFVVVHAHVEEGRSAEWRAHSGINRVLAAHLGGIDLPMTELASEKIWIAAQVFSQK